MKAQKLNKIRNTWLFIKRWWWLLPILVCLVWEVLKYRKTIKEIKKLEHVPAVVPVAVAKTPPALDSLKMGEILITKKIDEERVKILILPNSALQPWADSLYNAPAAYGSR